MDFDILLLLLLQVKSASFNVEDSCKLFLECVIHDGIKTCYLQSIYSLITFFFTFFLFPLLFWKQCCSVKHDRRNFNYVSFESILIIIHEIYMIIVNSHTPHNLLAAFHCFRVLFFLGRTVELLSYPTITATFTFFSPKLQKRMRSRASMHAHYVDACARFCGCIASSALYQSIEEDTKTVKRQNIDGIILFLSLEIDLCQLMNLRLANARNICVDLAQFFLRRRTEQDRWQTPPWHSIV